jgi:hypothetical protein
MNNVLIQDRINQEIKKILQALQQLVGLKRQIKIKSSIIVKE